jgi:hypothetical protein
MSITQEQVKLQLQKFGTATSSTQTEGCTNPTDILK